MDIRALKNFQVRDCDLDQLVYVDSQLKLTASSYSNREIDVPEWIGDKLVEIDAEIKILVKTEKLAKLKKLQSQRAALMTNEEKRQKLDKLIEDLQKSM